MKNKPLGIPKEITHKAAVQASSPKHVENEGDQAQEPEALPPAEDENATISKAKRKKLKRVAKKLKKAQLVAESDSQTGDMNLKTGTSKKRKAKSPSSKKGPSSLGKPSIKSPDTVAAANIAATSAAAAAAIKKEDPVAHLKSFVSAKQIGTVESENLTLTRKYLDCCRILWRWKC